MHNSLAMCGWWLWNRIRIISAFIILLLHPNRQIIFQSSALSAICCFFRQDLCKYPMHSHDKPKIKDVFLSCCKPIEIQIWKWYALWLSCMKWSSLAMIVFVLYLQVLTDALIRKEKWSFWNNIVCYCVFYRGGSASAIALKWWIVFGLMTSWIGKKIWRIWSSPTSTTQSSGYPTIEKKNTNTRRLFPLTFPHFASFLDVTFDGDCSFRARLASINEETAVDTPCLVQDGWRLGSLDGQFRCFFSGLKLKNSLFWVGRHLTISMPSPKGRLFSCLVAGRWLSVYFPWNGHMARRMVSWTLIFSCR